MADLSAFPNQVHLREFVDDFYSTRQIDELTIEVNELKKENAELKQRVQQLPSHVFMIKQEAEDMRDYFYEELKRENKYHPMVSWEDCNEIMNHKIDITDPFRFRFNVPSFTFDGNEQMGKCQFSYILPNGDRETLGYGFSTMMLHEAYDWVHEDAVNTLAHEIAYKLWEYVDQHVYKNFHVNSARMPEYLKKGYPFTKYHDPK